MGKELLQEAMRVLSITALWKNRGWLGQPGKSCNFPNDTDRKKAGCSIFTATTGKHIGKELFKNHKTGETFDAPGLLASVENLPIKEACRLFISLAGCAVKPLDAPDRKRSKIAPASKTPPPPKQETPKAPPFDFRALNPRKLNDVEVKAIATMRGVSPRTVEGLVKWGVLSAVRLSPDLRLPIPREALPIDAWAMHSPFFKSFRLRAFCGSFPGFDGRTSKSLTPSGASCSQPVWIGPLNATRLLVVEGEGDGIAAVDLARREKKPEGLAIIVIFSSSLALPSSFLPSLEGRKVRIVPHCGDSKNQGTIAAVRWAATAKPWAAAVELYSLEGLTMPDGLVVGDLGDLARCPDSTLHGLEVTTW